MVSLFIAVLCVVAYLAAQKSNLKLKPVRIRKDDEYRR